jgi:hypothetical protein
MHRGAVAHTLRLGLLVVGVLAVSACGGAKPLSEEYGSLSPSRYVADKFQPALSFEVGKGWEVLPTSEQEQKSFFELSRGYEGDDYFVSISFNNPPARVSDPRNPNKLVLAPKDWVSWFQERPYLDTSDPKPTSVGGVEGRLLATEASTLPEDLLQRGLPRGWGPTMAPP